MDPDWIEQGVLDVIKLKYWSFIPRRGSGRREERPIRRDLVAGAIAKGRDGRALSEDELTALFARRGRRRSRTCARRPTSCGASWPATS